MPRPSGECDLNVSRMVLCRTGGACTRTSSTSSPVRFSVRRTRTVLILLIRIPVLVQYRTARTSISRFRGTVRLSESQTLIRQNKGSMECKNNKSDRFLSGSDVRDIG